MEKVRPLRRNTPTNFAGALLEKSPEALEKIRSSFLKVKRDNLIERPWGGNRLSIYKQISQPAALRKKRFGEVFEVSSFSKDPETRKHPSVITFSDGSSLTLPQILQLAGKEILGKRFYRVHGPEIPLLPKTLDIKEMLSVQTHPPGHPEIYIILDAEPGATLRLGFRKDISPQILFPKLKAGRKAQEEIWMSLKKDISICFLQKLISTHFWHEKLPGQQLLQTLSPWLRPGICKSLIYQKILLLEAIYQDVLHLMNEIPVSKGQCLVNGTRAFSKTWTPNLPPVEVHALGNPEGKEILLLEIRRPGPTLRAWDHVRFPLRPLALQDALQMVNPFQSDPESFFLRPKPIKPGISCLVDCPAFLVKRLCPRKDDVLEIPLDEQPRTLHAIQGKVLLQNSAHRTLGYLAQGESALIPASLSPYYRVISLLPDSELIQVKIPLPAL